MILGRDAALRRPVGAARRPYHLEHLLNKMRRDEFSLRLHARAKFTHRKFRVGVRPGAIVPTGLREIHRMIIAIGM
jgi:hypothetical protein